MGILFLVFMLLAVVLGIASLVAFVLLDIQAFRESALWGLLVLFLSPIAALIFAIRNWEQARRTFLVYAGSLVGSIVLAVLAVGAGVGAAVTSAAAELDQAAVRASSEAPLPVDRVPQEQPASDDLVAAAIQDVAGSAPEGEVAVGDPETVETEPETVPVATDLLDPQDDRARRTQERVAGEETAQAIQDENAVPAGYTLVSFGEASTYLGRQVRVLDDEGNLHQGTLSQASRGKLVIERELSGGTVSYELKPSDVRSLQIYFR